MQLAYKSGTQRTFQAHTIYFFHKSSVQTQYASDSNTKYTFYRVAYCADVVVQTYSVQESSNLAPHGSPLDIDNARENETIFFAYTEL